MRFDRGVVAKPRSFFTPAGGVLPRPVQASDFQSYPGRLGRSRVNGARPAVLSMVCRGLRLSCRAAGGRLLLSGDRPSPRHKVAADAYAEIPPTISC